MHLAAYQDHTLYFIVTLVPIALEQSVEPLQGFRGVKFIKEHYTGLIDVETVTAENRVLLPCKKAVF